MSDGTPTIRELDAATVEQIAAGEVVERPASAVKELVENSLDAEATRIDVGVESGGTEHIEVIDDGIGMDKGALRQAVKPHTTSKIRDIDDLETGVGSLGFRGEALSSIGAVSRLTIRSRPQTQNGTATEIRVEGGDIVDIAPTGRSPGTTVTVEDLFYNVPARREFLDSDRTEFRHVNRVVTRYALANPAVAMSLTHGDRETFATPGDGDRRAAVLAVYGRDVAESMIDVDATPTGPLDHVYGLISDPETTRSSREYLSTFVNGRFVESGALREAILEGYDTHLAADRFPFATLFVECPPDIVDPNVHPRKLSVRFADEVAVQSAVESVVRSALSDANILRGGAPRGRSAPADTPIEQGTLDQARTEPDETAQSDSKDISEGTGDSVATPNETSHAGGTSQSGDAGNDHSDTGHARHTRLSGPTVDRTLSSEETSPQTVSLESLPSLRLLGQFKETYLVAESQEGLVLIDQHAADERVHYEAFREQIAGSNESQGLLTPVEVELTAAEAETFQDALPTLRSLGFEATLSADNTATVSAVPTVLGESLEPSLLQDMLTEAVDATPAEPVEEATEAILGDLACHPSVTANTSLDIGSIVDLLGALDECENPYACPHGRPTLVALKEADIEARFERDYPGHQTREPESDSPT